VRIDEPAKYGLRARTKYSDDAVACAKRLSRRFPGCPGYAVKWGRITDVTYCAGRRVK
jgi:hypothetical protein